MGEVTAGYSTADSVAIKKKPTFFSYLCDSIEYALNYMANNVPEHNFYLQKNFAPVSEGTLDENLEVKGTLPTCLNGEFVRNGPNPKFKPISGYHWFDGDGMLHGVRIKDGKASYVNRFVRTSRLIQEEEYGRPMFCKLGDMAGYVGVGKVLLYELRKKLGIIDDRKGFGTGNTALVFHAGRLMALHEGDLPYAIQVLLDGELETLGRQDYEGRLDHAFTAHPKVDPVTGEMFTFGYNVEKAPYVKYHVISKGGVLGPAVPVTLPDPIMMHDFAITENYAIFIDAPFIFRPKEMIKTGSPFFFDEAKPMRFGLLPRYDVTESKLRWFELPTGFIFHTANAFEIGDNVFLYACRLSKIDLSTPSVTSTTTGEDLHLSLLYEFRFNVVTGEAMQRQLTAFSGDFPRINDLYMGRQQRYVYGAVLEGAFFAGVAKYDLTREPDLTAKKCSVGGVVVGFFHHGPSRYGSDPIFVPASADPNSGSPLAEDDGYILNFVCDEVTGKSTMVVINAKTMEAEPVATVSLPRRVPFGFHGIFVSEEQLLAQGKSP